MSEYGLSADEQARKRREENNAKIAGKLAEKRRQETIKAQRQEAIKQERRAREKAEKRAARRRKK